MTSLALRPFLPSDKPFLIDLYERSFPEEERRPTRDWLEMPGRDAAFCLNVIEADGVAAGLLTVWQFGEFAYVEHFAVSPERRGGGLGARALQTLVESVQVPIVLEVEPKGSTPMAGRRLAFDERQCVVLSPLSSMQPPYRPGGAAIALNLMSTRGEWLCANHEAVCKEIYRRVYGVAAQ